MRRFGFASLGKQGLVYAVGILLDRVVGFVMLPVYTRFMTPTDYGLLQLVAITLEIVSIVAGSRLATGIFRYYHKAETDAQKHQVLGTALVLMASLYFASAAALWVFADPISMLVWKTTEYANLVRVGGVGFAFSSLLIVPTSHLQLVKKSETFVAINAAKLGVQLTMNIILVVFLAMGAMGFLIGTLVANSVIGVLLVIMLVRSTRLRFSVAAARDLLRFGIPMIGTQVAGIILTSGDRFFLQNEDGSAAVGIYGIAYTFGFLLTAIGYMPFQTAWEPVRFEVAKREDRDEIYSRVFVYFNILLMTVAMGIAVYVKDVIVVMTTPDFHSAASLVPVVLIAYALYSWTKVLDLGILISERTEFITLANFVAAGVAIAAYAVLIPPYAGFGAAWATVIAFVVRLIMIHAYSQKLWRVEYRWSPVFRVIVLATATYGVTFFITTDNVVLSLLMRTVLVGLYGVVMWFAGILSDTDRTFIQALVRSPKEAMASLARE